MILILIACVAVLTFFFEKYVSQYSLEHLYYHCEFDETLVEPEQKFTMTSYVQNNWKYPILYVGLFEYLNNEVTLLQDEKWKKRYGKNTFLNLSTKYRFYLMPYTKFVTKIDLSLPKRGIYEIGEYYMEAGDLLGFRTDLEKRKIDTKIIVIPKRSSLPVAIQTLGGFIGDISVRRFILEDPVLTIGFRDYSSSDPMKSISWKQTARMNKMQVKQYDYTVDASVAVLLNMQNGTKDSIESCLELTRTACEELEKKKIPFEFYSNGDTSGPFGHFSWLAEGLGAQHLNTIMYALGKSNCVCITSLDEMVDRCIQRRKSNRSYILITSELSETGNYAMERLQKYSNQQICILTAPNLSEQSACEERGINK